MARRKAHPNYPNPTIAEALCELHFKLADGVDWKSTLPGEVFKQIQGEFPEMEPVQEVSLGLDIGQRGAGTKALATTKTRFRFKHRDRPILVQLSDQTFTLNALPRYPGWRTMAADLERLWARISKIIQVSAITRIGLRYINKVAKENPNQPASDWFKESNFIPKDVLAATGRIVCRVDVDRDAENRVIVTLGTQPADDADEYGSFVLDIDRIVQREIAIDPRAVCSEADRLHDDAWGIFESAKTERLERLLKKRPK